MSIKTVRLNKACLDRLIRTAEVQMPPHELSRSAAVALTVRAVLTALENGEVIGERVDGSLLMVQRVDRPSAWTPGACR